MIFTEEDLQRYAKPLSDTEDQRCKNAIAMVRGALKEIGYQTGDESRVAEGTSSYSVKMSKEGMGDLTIFVQGSYANNTNVKAHSDVDIAVIWETTFRTKFRQDADRARYGFVSANKGADDFKGEIERALRKKFGDDVERGNKSIKVHGNTYRVDEDTVPTLRFRDYSKDWSYDVTKGYEGGIAIYPDDGSAVIINYPEQHITSGREKNVATNHSYKKCVRVAKKMMLLMQKQGYSSADKVSSFVVESLVWNVPNSYFIGTQSLISTFGNVVDYLCTVATCLSSLKEANGIKPLLSDGRRESDIRQFIQDLRNFYQFI